MATEPMVCFYTSVCCTASHTSARYRTSATVAAVVAVKEAEEAGEAEKEKAKERGAVKEEAGERHVQIRMRK